MNRDSIIKALTVLSAVALVLFVGFCIVKSLINRPEQSLKEQTSEPATLDENDALKASIDSLEASWQKVQSFEFRVGQDPLHLGRVIKDYTYTQAGFKEMEEEESIRLTATVIDDKPKAIIKFRGKSYVVQVGEMIENAYRVVSIDKKVVILDHGGGQTILTNKPVREIEPPAEESGFSNNASSEDGNY